MRLEELPDRDRRGDAGRDQEQPIERKRLTQDHDNAPQIIGDARGKRLRAPDDADELAQHNGEPEGKQEIGAALAPPIKVAQENPLERHPDPADGNRGKQEREQEAAGHREDGKTDISPKHEDRTMHARCCRSPFRNIRSAF